jgi:anti-anti-sigma factor
MSESDLSVQVELDLDLDDFATESAFVVSSNGASTIVLADGELDLGSRAALRDVLSRLEGVVVIDLADVTFLDSSAIGTLVGARNRLLESGGALRLRAPRDSVRRTLEILGLADWIVG